MVFYSLNAFWFLWIFGRFRNILICCDAVNAIKSSDAFAAGGWLSHLPYEGYRSINVFAFTHFVRVIGFFLTPSGPVAGMARPAVYIDAPYAVGAILIYALTGTVFVIVFRRFKGFFSAFSAVFLNPVSMGVLPTPLQESQMVLIIAPLLLTSFLLIGNHRQKTSIVAIAALAGAAWMVKPSFFLAMIGAWIIIGYLIISAKQKMLAAMSALTGLAIFLILLAPQLNLSLNRWGSVNPYPNTTVLQDQLSWGNEMWHYETLINSGETPHRVAARSFRTPYPHVEPENYATYLLNNPLIALSLAGGHIIGAFDYANLQTYVPSHQTETFAPFNVFVGFAMISALFNWMRRIATKAYGADDAILDVFFFATIAPLVILAAETRFSLFPMLVLSLRSLMWMHEPLPSSVRLAEATVSAVFGLFFASAVGILASTAFVP